MAEVQDYTSAYEGTQMDQAFERILGMKMGSVTITATADGSAFLAFTLDKDYSGFQQFCSARCLTSPSYNGEIGAQLSYTSGVSAVARIWGDGVQTGETYQFDYMLIR